MRNKKLEDVLTEEQIYILSRATNLDYCSVSVTNLIDVNDTVNFSGWNLVEIPISFGRVYHNFWCDKNKLTTLKNAPKAVHKIFNCDKNNLISLFGAPQKIIGDFYCQGNNELKSLEGINPQNILGCFNFSCNNIDRKIVIEILYKNMKEYHLTWEEAVEKHLFIFNEKELAQIEIPETLREKYRGKLTMNKLNLL